MLQNTDNLFKAFGLFLEAFRAYIVSTLMKKQGEDWSILYVESLHPEHKEIWNQGIRSGTKPELLIDYPNLRSFAIKNKELLKPDFGKETNNLPTRLDTLYGIRNKLAHFTPVSSDEYLEAFINMKNISGALNMTELKKSLELLQEGKTESQVPKDSQPTENIVGKPWFLEVTPHLDIREGRLDESIFAANLGEVALGNGREIYNNPVEFFSKTYFTAGLKNVAKTVISGLNGNINSDNRSVSLQTGFGGGKTHTMISLYHICKWGKSIAQSKHASDLIQYTGIPNFDSAKIAVFTNTTNDPANGRTVDGLTIQTLWGELAYQLGGKEAYEIVRKNDEQLIAPGGIFKKVLEICKPSLILIDELADYCVKASARKAGSTSLADQTISFMQELTESVTLVDRCVAVISLPASPEEVGNTQHAHSILKSLEKRVSRVGKDTQPVADEEIFEVIRRRLFENVGSQKTIEEVASKYYSIYQTYPNEFPSNSVKTEYKEKIKKSYPFHPELIDVFRIRWASHHDFQRTRGVLRLLASIVSDLWKRKESLPGVNLLIHSGMVNFANIDAIGNQLKKLYGNGYDAVITADVSGSSSNSFKIDSNRREYGQWSLSQAVASTILLNSFGSDGTNKGTSVPDIKLQIYSPDSYNHNTINATIDELESSAYYLYYAQSGALGKRYWFHTKPNINILINMAKNDIKTDSIHAEIVKRLKEKNFRNSLFNVLIEPSLDIPEQMKPTLLFLSPNYIALFDSVKNDLRTLVEKIALKKGNTERIFRNTMLFLVCLDQGAYRLETEVQDYLAIKKISVEYHTQLEKEQREDIKKKMEEASKKIETNLAIAYSVVIKYSQKNGLDKIHIKDFKDSLENQIDTFLVETLKTEEWLLDSIGIGTLKENNLFPTLERGVQVKEIYEAFLRFDDKPMITGKSAIEKSVLRYCLNGEFCIAYGDGSSFDKYYYKENVPLFDVTESKFWLLDKSKFLEKNQATTEQTQQPSLNITNEKVPQQTIEQQTPSVRTFNTIVVSGKVPLDNYTELMNCFITPFASLGNKIDIEIQFTIRSNPSNRIDENLRQYKSAKEAAKQLGLKFEES